MGHGYHGPCIMGERAAFATSAHNFCQLSLGLSRLALWYIALGKEVMFPLLALQVVCNSGFV